ncbi:unnamed protein product, partial [Meganyctiphanes norvegica]
QHHPSLVVTSIALCLSPRARGSTSSILKLRITAPFHILDPLVEDLITMNNIFWLLQLVLLGEYMAQGFNSDIPDELGKIINTYFDKVATAVFEDKTQSEEEKRKRMQPIDHGFRSPNNQSMQLTCIWDSIRQASSTIRNKFSDELQAFEPWLNPIITNKWKSLSKTICGSDVLQPLCCDENHPYRSNDGTCNNLINTRWGSAPRPYERYLKADYGDKNFSPRKSFSPHARKGGKIRELPSPRTVSNAMKSAAVPQPTPTASVMFMQWGQFLNHDMQLTPVNVTGIVARK